MKKFTDKIKVNESEETSIKINYVPTWSTKKERFRIMKKFTETINESGNSSLNTYIMIIANTNNHNVKTILVESNSLEDAIQKSKSLVFPSQVTDGKSLEEITDMFNELGFVFRSEVIITGSDYDVKIIKD